MPNIKISQLPFSAAPDGSTVFPCVIAGVTYQTSLQDVVDNYLNGELAGTFQLLSDKTQSIYADGTSMVKYPSAMAVKNYADGLVVGLLSDRGNYTPGLVSPGAFPTTGGRGPGGAPLKGDLWFVAANGFLGTTAVLTGQSVRALVDAPGQTAANWDILDVAGWTVAPEDSSNRVLSKADFITNGSSTAKYPSVKAVKDYIDTEVTLQDVITNDNALTDNNNLQGLNAGLGMTPGVTDVNAFGESAAQSNTASSVNAIGKQAANANTGTMVNAIGENAAANNTGISVDAIGFGALENNTGGQAVGIGSNAGENNSGNNFVGVGEGAGKNNSADGLTSVGGQSGQNNTGLNTTGVGVSAANGNTGDSLAALGYFAGATNSGENVNAVGYESANGNSGDNVNAMGYNAATGNSATSVNAFGKNAGVNNTHSFVTILHEGATADGPSQIAMKTVGGNAFRIDANSVTSDRKLTVPDATGIIPISVNNITADPSGNITLPSQAGLPYLIYSAYLTFGYGIVTATQLYNTIGDGSGDGINDIAWTFTNLGADATMTSGPFTTKTVVIPSGYVGSGIYYSITGQRSSSSLLNLFSLRVVNSGFAKAFGVSAYVEIRIYP